MAGVYAEDGSLNVTVSSDVTVSALTGTNSATLSSSTKNRKLIYAHVVYAASADTGNRTIVMQLINNSNVVVGDWHVTPNTIANDTNHIEFMGGTYRETAFDANDTVQTPFPVGLIIPAGYTLKFVDAADIDDTDDAISAYVMTVL